MHASPRNEHHLTPAPRDEGARPREPGQDISDASRQLRALAMLSGSLTDPLTPRDAADVVERQALAVLGATSAVVVTLGGFPPNDVLAGGPPLAPGEPTDRKSTRLN